MVFLRCLSVVAALRTPSRLCAGLACGRHYSTRGSVSDFPARTASSALSLVYRPIRVQLGIATRYDK